ncbi:MAG: hypothetical protein GXO93_06450 [FCB group bacterium]|nr:hypothetical protein [FCB group bacterium]
MKKSVIKYWIYNSDISHLKLSKFIRFDKNEIINWIKENVAPPCGGVD